jgi:nicotinate-nucleotide--dimethylbenzimidazole phosphoribosyltransferase
VTALYEAILFDIGGTLLRHGDPSIPANQLKPELLPDVCDDLLRLSRSYRLGAVTNTSVMTEADVRGHLSAVGIDEFMEVVVTSVDAGVEKPDPEPILMALRRLAVAPERALYVGDLATDLAAARAAGCGYAYRGATLCETIDAHLSRAERPFTLAARAIAPLDAAALAAAEQRHDRLAKPPGSLGALERVGIQLAGIAGQCPPPEPMPAAVGVFVADHGVVESGVTMWPQAITGLVASVVAQGGAGISVIARTVGASVHVVDVGGVSDLSASEGIEGRSVRRGTANLALEAAMTEDEALTALDTGLAVAREMVEGGARCLITGEVGIGNTTAAAAVVSVLTGLPPYEVTGYGAGADEATFGRKAAVIEAASVRVKDVVDPLTLLAEVGGLEIAALAGFIVGGAEARVPVLIDGGIACAALFAAAELAPGVERYCIAGHRSPEPAASIVLERLQMEPLLDLGLRLGEGTGACLALPLVKAAARVLGEMALLDDL